jgi:chromosome partitioning protein
MSECSFCLLSPKGGVGKTTTAVLLASEVIRHGKSVTLIEADSNQHLASWFELGNCPKGLSVISIGNATG